MLQRRFHENKVWFDLYTDLRAQEEKRSIDAMKNLDYYRQQLASSQMELKRTVILQEEFASIVKKDNHFKEFLKKVEE